MYCIYYVALEKLLQQECTITTTTTTTTTSTNSNSTASTKYYDDVIQFQQLVQRDRDMQLKTQEQEY